ISPADSSLSQTSPRMCRRRGAASTRNRSTTRALPSRGLTSELVLATPKIVYRPEAAMSQIITLALDVQADPARLFKILTTTEGQRGFWTADCDVAADKARFGFEASPVDLDTTLTTEPDKLIRMSVTSGFPFWQHSSGEWTLFAPLRTKTGTGVLYHPPGFTGGSPEIESAHPAQVWAMTPDRLARYAETGTPQPFFPAPA